MILTGDSVNRRAITRITLAITTSPTKNYHEEKNVVAEPPIRGPTATAMSPSTGISPYARGGASTSALPASNATITGTINAAPIPSSSDQPMSHMPRFDAQAVIIEPEV
jgi:hypothetical protein